MKWSELSMTERNEVIKMAVAQGIRDIPSIKNLYEESVNGSRRFDDGGGLTSLPSNWTMQDEAKYRNWRENLPVNLRNTNDNDYDMRRAYLAGMRPSLEDDGYYHLGSRDPKTGRILKAPHHPTYLQAINTDARIGYYPTIDKQGVTYTSTWEGNKYELGGPKRDRMPAHPKRGNEEKDPEAIAAYQQYESDMAERRKVSAERAKQYIEEKARRNIEAAKEFNRRKDVVMSQLEDEASSIPFTEQDIQEAAEQQRQDKLNTWRPIVNMADIATNAVGVMSGNPWILGAVATPDIFQTIDHAANEGIKGSDLLSLGFDALGVLGASNILRPLKYSYRQRTKNRYGLPIERDKEIQYGKYLDAFSDWGGKAWGIKDAGDDAIDLWDFSKRVNPNNQFYFKPFSFAEGGSIHIAPSKRGTFTAAAAKHGKSVQEFASQVLAHKENYSPAMVKKANFARNASKWKH